MSETRLCHTSDARTNQGMRDHDLGPKGRSRRPSGTKDASATTGVDPQDPPGTRSA